METEGQPLSTLQMLSLCEGYSLYLAKEAIVRVHMFGRTTERKLNRKFLEFPSPQFPTVKTRKIYFFIQVSDEMPQLPWWPA